MAAKESLDQFIDPAHFECLNQDGRFPVENAFKDGDDMLTSDKDVDGDLLVKCQFRQSVKLSAIKIEGLAEAECHPDSIKIFQGNPDLDFQEANENAPTESVALEADKLGRDGHTHNVKFVKFQNVTSLQLFFPVGEDQDRQQTKIKRITFFGEPAQAMDMKAWKPVKG